jgi:hemolysin activation/secretion protein
MTRLLSPSDVGVVIRVPARVSARIAVRIAGRVAIALIAVGAVGAVAKPAPADPQAAGGTAAEAAKAAAIGQENRFDVHEYRVLGNTVLSNRDIETVLYPLLGDHKTLADVETARAALEKSYHEHGFGTVFVDIPEQEIADKVVRLKVTEGRLNEVRISGARYYSERKILAAVPAATAGTVPNLPALQEQLSAVGVKSADRAVVPILKAGPLPGTVDLALKVDDHLPFHGSLEFDNQNTPSTKPLRSTVSLSYNNLFQDFDSLSAQYQIAPQEVSQVNVVAVNYSWGEAPGGLHPSVYFIDSNSDVPTVGTVGVLGKGQIAGARVAFFTDASPTSPQSLTLGADYKHFRQTIALAGSPGVNTPITYSNFSLAYAGNWSSDSVSGALSSAANFGPRGAPNSPTAFADKRFQGHPNYFYLKLDGSLVARLPAGFRFIVRADGQLAAEPLITNEDFSISGADGVRGYLEAEVLADKGLKGSVQFESPMAKVRSSTLGDGFLFYDAGRANLIDPLANEPASTVLRSWGVGLNLLPSYWLNGVLTWADPLRSGPYTRRGDSRILFVVRGSF